MSAKVQVLRTFSVLTLAVGLLPFAATGCSGPMTPKPAFKPEINAGRPEVYSAWPFSAEEAVKRQEATAKALGQPKEITLDLGNKVTLKLALIPAGKFLMGSSKSERQDAVMSFAAGRTIEEDEGGGREDPQHEVTITKPYYMGIYAVTQEQYEQVMGKNPSNFKGSANPVETVSWDDAAKFCEKLSAKVRKAVRLPTEAQWEYACRAGTKTPFNTGQTISTDQANYDGQNWLYGKCPRGIYRMKPLPVGSFKPNAFGLYDMNGNMAQWCSDRYDEKYYRSSPKADPMGPANGEMRIIRGGTWCDPPWAGRSASRLGNTPDYGSISLGFRVVVPAPPAGQPGSEPVVYSAWPFSAAEASQRQEATARALCQSKEMALDLGYQATIKLAVAKGFGQPKEITLGLGHKVTMKLALIPAGKFMMGSPESERQEVVKAAAAWVKKKAEDVKEWKWFEDENPQHEVTISKPFYMGVYHVTQEQYEQVMCENPRTFQGQENHPVYGVSWEDAAEFCNRLSARTGMYVKLPTEAQWEYACRAGTKTPFNTGETISMDQANFRGKDTNGNGPDGIHPSGTTPVGAFKPNAFGLYDMHGNVPQWCSDSYDQEYYRESPKADPTGPAYVGFHVYRGRSSEAEPWDCRSASRMDYTPGFMGANRYRYNGFRVVVAVGAD